jgi:HEAT repeat protein
MTRRAHGRRRTASPRRVSISSDIPYRAILRSLRGHPSAETERFLMLAAQDWDPLYRTAALASLGWWEPVLRRDVQGCLEAGRRDPSQEVRQAARGALARLGERAALHWFRQALLSENPQQVFEAVHVVAAEGLTLLWPDLDRLVDSDHPEIAHHAREALERLAEEMDYTLAV